MHLKSTLSVLAIAAVATMAKDFSGAELYTFDEYTYGKYEARMKMAAASGTVSSMFLYQNGSEQASATRWVEVDIEVLGQKPNSFQSNIITGKAGNQVTSEKHHTVSPAADQGFHTYGIEWTPNYVRWTVDGVEVRKTEKGVNDEKNQVANLIGTQGLRFNLWSSESQAWVGAFDESKLPLFQFINWVKAYKYTPGQGPNGSDFTLDWADNFDNFNGSRWGKGDWTFDGNRVDLTDKNIYSRDGMLILALTRKGQENFNGQVPQDAEGDAEFNGSTQQQSSSSVASSSSEQYNPPSSSSQENNPFVSSSSSADPTGILPTRVKLQNKDIRGTVNAKGARVNPNNKANYQVDFNF
ncbi:family 16 glycosylhydrolase [Fibrobacter sp.]|jgi:beta-glucanase (GH16 family)|uniref:glycoside hydrolase family 16 protein n=1 Tax=Fibrobacter sp. TaxID=35828 RepID=UPI003868C884